MSIVKLMFAQDCKVPFFSEYIEGSSYNKCLEIYNPTDSLIDLTAEKYMIKFYFNGSTIATTIVLTGKIDAKDVFVLCHDSSNASYLVQSDQTISSAMFNGDDAITLMKDTLIVDQIGEIGIDPGLSWAVGNGTTVDHTLVRKYDIKKGTPSWSLGAGQWDVFQKDTDSLLGSHTSYCNDSILTNSDELSSVFIHSYPNPAHDYIQFFIPLREISEAEIIVIDHFGRVVNQPSVIETINGFFLLPVDRLIAGSYWFRIHFGSGEFFIGRFIKI